MYRIVVITVLLIPQLLAAAQAAVAELPIRKSSGSHSRVLSSVTGNLDHGIQELVQGIAEQVLEQSKKKIYADFFKAAQVGEGLEEFLKISDFNFNAKNEDDGGKTALMYVAKLGRPTLVAQLMAKRALAFSIKDNDGYSAYDHATGYHDVRQLMDQAQPGDRCRRSSIEERVKTELADLTRKRSIVKMMDDVNAALYAGQEKKTKE